MEYLQPAIMVLLILGAVLVAALAFQPNSFIGHWRVLSDLCGTENGPRKVSFPDEHVLVGGLSGGVWPLGVGRAEFAKFDIELDEDGLWLLYDGPAPEKCAPRLFIPGTHVKYLKDNGDRYSFLIHADKPIPIQTSSEPGAAMKSRLMGTVNPISFD